MNRIAAALVLSVLVLAVPARADAATAQLVYAGERTEYGDHGSSLTYPAYSLVYAEEPGETAALTARGLELRDTNHLIAPGAGCATVADGVRCDATTIDTRYGARVESIDLSLGDGDDTLTIAGAYGVSADTGPGSDLIRLTDGNARVKGGDGADSFLVHRDDPRDSRDWNAVFDGGAGPDAIDVGPLDRAQITYASYPEGVKVTRDGVANDGVPGEGDNVGPGVTAVVGSAHADEIDAVGGKAIDVKGGDGNDTITGGDGDDTLRGEGGDDVVRAGGGRDVLEGYPGTNTLDGGAGDDKLYLSRQNQTSNDDAFGRDGFDTGSYVDVIEGTKVVASLDDQPGDGPTGDNDNVHSDIEMLDGQYGDDHFIGNDGPNRLDGGQGENVLEGRGGDDVLFGADEYSSTGVDGSRLDGGGGADFYDEVGLKDRVLAQDGTADVIRCRGAISQPVADTVDTSTGCLTWSGLPGGKVTLRFDSHGRTKVTVNCETWRGGPCRGRVVLTWRHRVRGAGWRDDVISRTKYEVPKNVGIAPRRFTLKLSARWQRELRTARRMTVTATYEQVSTAPAERKVETVPWRLVAPAKKRRR